ncbi:MAG: bifunctional 2-C-methyl-D-erythritol 4-phosphate cytidylyltransferase/2-C-methyl-D-erythritol 2,4-cyclodiphosphate synthase [Marinomonas sp.]
MTKDTALASTFAAVIIAAGKGLRVGGDIPKQFRILRGKPLLRHSAERLLAHGADRIMVAIPEGGEELAKAALAGLENIDLVTGGATRQASVRNALETLSADAHQNVLIHDAARPFLPPEVTERLLAALSKNKGAIPALPVVDSIAVEENGVMIGAADRDTLRRVQTPQAFRFEAILAAHRSWSGDQTAGDDAQVLRANGGTIALVEGDERLKKVTIASDMQTQGAAMRIGQGYDVHALATGEELWLCGVKLDHHMGLAGHSDADVALHAVVDAILGAIGDGDIGTHFPPSDPQWKGAASPMFVEHACKLMREAGYALGNLDLTIICEAPKIGPHRDAMRTRLADIMDADVNQISIKATTTEKLGFTGRGEGIAAQATILLTQEENQ